LTSLKKRKQHHDNRENSSLLPPSPKKPCHGTLDDVANLLKDLKDQVTSEAEERKTGLQRIVEASERSAAAVEAGNKSIEAVLRALLADQTE
jgi:ribosomal protein L17